MVCRSSIGKVSKNAIEENAGVLRRRFDLMGSGIDIVEFTIRDGRQLMTAKRASGVRVSRAISCSEL